MRRETRATSDRLTCKPYSITSRRWLIWSKLQESDFDEGSEYHKPRPAKSLDSSRVSRGPPKQFPLARAAADHDHRCAFRVSDRWRVVDGSPRLRGRRS